MRILVFIEPLPAIGFRAAAGAPFGLSADGATDEEALGNLKELIAARMNADAKIVEIEIPAAPHPLARWAGTHDPDDPVIKEWKQALQEYRDQVERDPDYR